MPEPIKSKHALILNRLAEMQRAPYYATARTELQTAEQTIVELERGLDGSRRILSAFWDWIKNDNMPRPGSLMPDSETETFAEAIRAYLEKTA